MPKEREQGSSVSTAAVNDNSGTSISPAITGLIKSSVAESIGPLANNLTQVRERETNSSWTMPFKWWTNLMEHPPRWKQNRTRSGPPWTWVLKRIKVIKMADRSDFGWSSVNEYLLDELPSNSDDEKRIYRVQRRAERKTKERRRRLRPTDRKESASSTSRAFSPRLSPSYSTSGQPNRRVYSSSQRLGPCFKISSFLYFTR